MTDYELVDKRYILTLAPAGGFPTGSAMADMIETISQTAPFKLQLIRIPAAGLRDRKKIGVANFSRLYYIICNLTDGNK